MITIAILLGLPASAYQSMLEQITQNSLWTFLQSQATMFFAMLMNWFQLSQVLLGPLTWVTAGYLAGKIPTASKPKFNAAQLLPEPRHKRRRPASFSPPKRRTKLKTACDYNLTSKYPLRLQREHQYNTRSNTPTSEQQRVQTTLNLWILFAEESKRKRKIYMAAQ